MASFGNYLLHNLFGNWNAGTWNVLPAVLTTWSNLISNGPNKTSYELYKEQARTYKETAEKNAKLIESQGAIALRNLQYQSKLQRGNDVLRIAASGSNMSGSNLDVVVRKEKIRAMNEMALRANYQNQILMELQNGYNKAAMTYGELAAKAEGDKKSPWLAILKGIETYVGLSVQDGKQASQLSNYAKQNEALHQAQMKHTTYEYEGSPKVKKGTLSGDGKSYDNSSVLNPTKLALISDSDNTLISWDTDNTIPFT